MLASDLLDIEKIRAAYESLTTEEIRLKETLAQVTSQRKMLNKLIAIIGGEPSENGGVSASRQKTDEEKIVILRDKAVIGSSAAARKHNVSTSAIAYWEKNRPELARAAATKDIGIGIDYSARRVFNDEEKIQILVDDEIFGPTEAAAKWEISTSSIYRWRHDSKLMREAKRGAKLVLNGSNGEEEA